MRKRLFVLLILILSLFIASSPAFSSEIAKLKQLAKDGNPEAQCILGARYITGEGVKPDASKAIKWFRRSAKQYY